MLSAGILDKVSKALKLPSASQAQELMEHAQHNLARASIAAALNASINGQPIEKAFT